LFRTTLLPSPQALPEALKSGISLELAYHPTQIPVRIATRFF
jgi:hypothetical protein